MKNDDAQREQLKRMIQVTISHLCFITLCLTEHAFSIQKLKLYILFSAIFYFQDREKAVEEQKVRGKKGTLSVVLSGSIIHNLIYRL